jgi:hypothetical protein
MLETKRGPGCLMIEDMNGMQVQAKLERERGRRTKHRMTHEPKFWASCELEQLGEHVRFPSAGTVFERGQAGG